MKALLKLPQDKLLHLVVGLAIFIVTVPFAGPVWAFGLACVVGFVKELYDIRHRDKHTPDLWDAIATATGGAAGFFCTYF